SIATKSSNDDGPARDCDNDRGPLTVDCRLNKTVERRWHGPGNSHLAKPSKVGEHISRIECLTVGRRSVVVIGGLRSLCKVIPLSLRRWATGSAFASSKRLPKNFAWFGKAPVSQRFFVLALPLRFFSYLFPSCRRFSFAALSVPRVLSGISR